MKTKLRPREDSAPSDVGAAAQPELEAPRRPPEEQAPREPLYWALVADDCGPIQIRDRDDSIDTRRKLRTGVTLEDGSVAPSPEDSVLIQLSDDPQPFFRMELDRALQDRAMRVFMTLEEATLVSAQRKAQGKDVANSILARRKQQEEKDRLRNEQAAATRLRTEEDRIRARLMDDIRIREKHIAEIEGGLVHLRNEVQAMKATIDQRIARETKGEKLPAAVSMRITMEAEHDTPNISPEAVFGAMAGRYGV